MEEPKKIRNSLLKNAGKASQGKKNRTSGHNYERQLAKEFREILGDTKCRTSRQMSRLLDECKVDLSTKLANVQAKNVRSNIDYFDLLKEIKALLTEEFPERLSLPTAIFHKKKGKEVIILSKEDFYNLIKLSEK